MQAFFLPFKCWWLLWVELVRFKHIGSSSRKTSFRILTVTFLPSFASEFWHNLFVGRRSSSDPINNFLVLGHRVRSGQLFGRTSHGCIHWRNVWDIFWLVPLSVLSLCSRQHGSTHSNVSFLFLSFFWCLFRSFGRLMWLINWTTCHILFCSFAHVRLMTNKSEILDMSCLLLCLLAFGFLCLIVFFILVLFCFCWSVPLMFSRIILLVIHYFWCSTDNIHSLFGLSISAFSVVCIVPAFWSPLCMEFSFSGSCFTVLHILRFRSGGLCPINHIPFPLILKTFLCREHVAGTIHLIIFLYGG